MATDQTSRQSNFVARLRDTVNGLLDARAAMKALREEAATQGYPAGLVVGAFAGANADLQASDLAAVFAALDATEGVLTDWSTTPPTPTANAAALLRMRR